MKPVLLTIEGLHSFREKQTIDFNQLTDAGVFGIFGPTGSGKSTILDGMTLALFGTVGRAKNRTQGILNHAENNLSVSFQFEIGTGSERKIYRIDRRYERNTEITVKNKYSRIYELDANLEELAVLSDKDGEVTQWVQEIIGLKPDDFSRAVVLPQGKFSEFLQLGGRDRREMLQRLFALERYGVNLTKKLNERYQKTKQSLDVIVAEQNGMEDCSREALQKAEALLQSTVEKEKQVLQTHSEMYAQFETAKRIVEWQEQVEDINSQLEEHQLADGEIQQIKLRIETAEKAERVLPFVKRYTDTMHDQQHYQTEQSHLETLVAELCKKAKDAKAFFEIAQLERTQKSPGFIKEQAQLETALVMEDELENWKEKNNELQEQYQAKQAELEETTSLLKKVTDLQMAIETEQQMKKDIMEKNTISPELRSKVQLAVKKQDEYQNAEKEEQEKQRDVNRRAQELANARTLLEKQGLQLQNLTDQLSIYEKQWQELMNRPPEEEDQLTKEEIQLSEGKTKVESLLRMEESNETDTGLKIKLEKDLADLSDSLQNANQQLDNARKQLDKLRHQQQTAILQDKQTIAIKLAADLCTGEACPVCGSVDHPNPAMVKELIENDTIQLDQLIHAIQELESLVNQLANEESNIKSDIRVKTEKIHDIRQSILSRRADSQSIRKEINQLTSPEMEDASGKKILEWVEEQRRFVQQKRLELTEWKQEKETLQEQIQKIKEEISTCSSKVAGYQQKVDSAQTEHQGAYQALQIKEKQVQSAQVSAKQALEEVGGESVEQILQDIHLKDQLAAEAFQQEKELQKKLTELKQEIHDRQNQENQLKLELTGLTKSLEEAQGYFSEIQTKWQQITRGVPATVLQAQLVQELAQLEEREKTARQAYEQISLQLVETERQYTEANTRSMEVDKLLQTVKKELEEQLAKYHFVTAEEVQDVLLKEEELNEYKIRLQEHQDKGKKLHNEKETLEKNLKGQQISEDRWVQIQAELQSAEQEKQDAIAIHGAMRIQYEKLREKHDRWMELESKRKELAKQFKYLDQLKSIFKGDKFVEFLAQEQLDAVARQASDRLKSLTHNRYALEIGEDGGFIMRDDANGGAKRPVSSLSGGETFLTSLALALSLSTQIQLRGKYPLEFFFLDEGFGTLDADLLEVVMTALEQLHLEKMTIGIISHVPELQQRLHRKLIVEPAEAAGRGSRVRVERL